MRVGVDAALGLGDAARGARARGRASARLRCQPPWCDDRLRDLVADPVERVERGHRLLEDHADAGAADAVRASRSRQAEQSPRRDSGPSRARAVGGEQAHRRHHRSGSCPSPTRRRSRPSRRARRRGRRRATACNHAVGGVAKRTSRSRESTGLGRRIESSPVLRVEGVAQAVADEVEREQGRAPGTAPGRSASRAPLDVWRASAISTPQLVRGSCTPSPRNDRKLSSRMTCGTRRVM